MILGRLRLSAVLILTVRVLISSPVEAQQPTKIPRIGYLITGYRSDILARTDAFRQCLPELGYEEGKNIVIEQRYAGDKIDRLSPLAAELVRLNVKVSHLVRKRPAAPKKRPLSFLSSWDFIKTLSDRGTTGKNF